MAKTSFRPGSKWGQSGANIYSLNTGNVGIGTTTPTAKLEVFDSVQQTAFTGTAKGTLHLRSTTATGDYSALTFGSSAGQPGAKIAFQQTAAGGFLHFGTTNNYGSGITNTAITINQIGNVGIGTTAPGAKLTITGASAAAGADNTKGILRLTTGTGASTDEALQFDVHDGDYSSIQAVKSGTAFRNLALNASGGNVGIGTTGPNYKLEVNGTGYFAGKVGINSAALGSNSLDVYSAASGAVMTVQSNGAVNGNSLITSVLGNSVTGSVYGLHVSGSTTGALYHYIQQNGAGAATFYANVVGAGDATSIYGINGGQAWSVGLDNSDSDKFKIAGSGSLGGSDRFTIDTVGNVGIGNTNPQEMLHVGPGGGAGAYSSTNAIFTNAGATSIEVRDSTNAVASAIYTSSAGGIFGTQSAHNLQFMTGDNVKMTILNSNGNVGIGNTAASAKLHVTGSELRLQTTDSIVSFFNTAGTRRGYIQGTEGGLLINSEQATYPIYLYAGGSLRATVGTSFFDLTVPARTSAGGAAGAGTQTLSTTLYNQSRTENLVTNGSGLLQNNYNFSTFTFDATELHGGGGSFLKNVASSGLFNDELIPIDPDKYYRLIGWGKSGDTGGANFNAANRQYLGIVPLDVDGNQVQPVNYSKYPGSTDTTLAVDLIPGATTVTLTDATGWRNAGSGYERNFIWYGYTNSKGYTYPNYTYSRTHAGTYSSGYAASGVWAAGGISGNVITLRLTWTGPTIPAGTAVRNNTDGGTFKYIAASNAIVPNAWTRYEGYIGGIDTAGAQNTNQFPYGAAYIKLLFLVNYHGAADNNIRWSDLSFTETSSRNLEVATATVPGVVSTSAQTFGGDKTFNGKVGIGTNPLSDRMLNITNTTASGTNYGVVNTMTGAGTNNYGSYLSVTGASNNNIGLYIVSTPDTATNYAIYSTAPAQSYIAGKLGLGVAPTAVLHLKAGTTTVAPLRLDSGTLKTTAAAGELEYNGTNLFFTPTGTTRRTIAYLPTSPPDYTVTNGTTDRTFDADATTTDELADVVSTLIADLTAQGLLS